MVGKELAVENPLAREIVNACGRLGLETLFEPTKIHPRDWANPGRVKIKLKGGRNSNIKNSVLPLPKSTCNCALISGKNIISIEWFPPTLKPTPQQQLLPLWSASLAFQLQMPRSHIQSQPFRRVGR